MAADARPEHARPGAGVDAHQADAALARVWVDIPVAWGEMDALGHVNNVVFFRYMETARIEYIRRLGDWARDGRPPGFILQSASIRFRRPVVFPDTLRVTARAVEVAADRFTLSHAMVSSASGEVVAIGQGVVVSYDYALGTKVPLSDTLRRAINATDGVTSRAGASG
ncbi:MAG: thioesterase family protein [Planctomycetota bacterium]|nr:thioesterase family protein [Planctomycetota bacterium]